jgi:NADH pyrophosphatase NudC (nudix superfamily)
MPPSGAMLLKMRNANRFIADLREISSGDISSPPIATETPTPFRNLCSAQEHARDCGKCSSSLSSVTGTSSRLCFEISLRWSHSREMKTVCYPICAPLAMWAHQDRQKIRTVMISYPSSSDQNRFAQLADTLVCETCRTPAISTLSSPSSS